MPCSLYKFRRVEGHCFGNHNTSDPTVSTSKLAGSDYTVNVRRKLPALAENAITGVHRRPSSAGCRSVTIEKLADSCIESRLLERFWNAHYQSDSLSLLCKLPDILLYPTSLTSWRPKTRSSCLGARNRIGDNPHNI